MNEREHRALEVLFAKGPVDIEVVQRKAHRAWVLVSQFFTKQECSDLMTARDHARIGEGRGEWDQICARVRDRLVKEGLK